MFNSIRKKMMVFILVPIIAVYAGVMAFNILKANEWHTEETRHHMTALAQNYAARFDGDLREIAQIALSTATFLETHPNMTEAQLYAQLEANVRRHPLVYGAAIAFEPYQFASHRKLFSPYVYKSGANLQQMDVAIDGYDYTDSKWTWWHLPKQKGEGVWTEPFFDEGAGNILMSTFSVPFYQNGAFRGVVTVDLPLIPLGEKVLKNVDRNTWVSIVMPTGQYVYSHKTDRILTVNIRDVIQAEKIKNPEKVADQILSGQPGSVLLDNQQHRVFQWTFYAPISSTGWIFLATLSDQVALGFVQEQLQQNLGILGLSLILIVFCIWFVSKRITDPLEQLSAATARMSEGDLNTSIAVKGNDEVGVLAETLEDMAQKIVAREQALEKERQNHFGQLVEGLSGKYFYYTHDVNGVFTFVSSSVEDILGYTPDEFQKHFESFLSDTPLNQKAILHTQGSIRGEQQPVYEIDVLHKDGDTRRVEIFERPIFDDRRQVVAVEGMSCDITNRIAEAERLAGLLNSAPDGMIVTNEDGEIVLVNVGAEKMFGYTREELLGQPIEILIPERLRADHPKLRHAFVKESVARPMGMGSELAAQRKDGSTFPVEISLSPFRAEEGLLISAAVRDITERKQADEALRQSRDEAEQAAREAEAANQAKSIFLANMSHEIRTPMNAILGFSEILSGMVHESQQKEYVDSIRTSGKSLLTLINDILDLSKVEAGELELENEAVALKQIFLDMKQVFGEKVAEKQLGFDIVLDSDLPDVVVLDESRLRQVLTNVIDNAVKFTKKGHVKLRVQGEDKEMGIVDLTIDVEDTGIGIPTDQQEVIFGTFAQREGQSINEYGGIGLGLAMSKRLVEMMNGQIVVSSQVGVGSIFRIRLNNVQVASHEALAIQDNAKTEDVKTGEMRQLHTVDTSDDVHKDPNRFELSAEVRARLPELIKQLEDRRGVCEDLAQTLTINDVEDFANEMQELACVYQYQPLLAWGEKLLIEATMFDMDGISDTLGGYVNLIDNLSEQMGD